MNPDLSTLPETLSRPLGKALRFREAGEWYRSLNYILDFLEVGVGYVSIVLLGLFRKEMKKTGAPVRKRVAGAVLKIDGKRPLAFGDWVNDILIPLALESEQAFPDNPIVAGLSTVVSKRGNIFIGGKGEQSLVQIRNRFRGHGTVLSDRIYQELVEAIFPRVQRFATALTGIDRCGLSLPDDLHPLVHRNGQGFEYVFQTLSDEQVSFLSTHEDAVPVMTESLNGAFDRWMQDIVPAFDIAKDLNWKELVNVMNKESDAYMADIYAQKKYNREVFVERAKMSEALQGFIESDAIIFPLQGEAGQGKTNQLCHWTETLTEAGEAVLVFSGSSFTDVPLEERIRALFGLGRRKTTESFLERTGRLAREEGRKVHIFFDAVNEAINYPGASEEKTGPMMLYEDICRLFGRTELSAFKVLLTCRSYTWRKEIMPLQADKDPALFYTPDDDSLSAVHGFTDEEVEKAYSVYGELYQMGTPFGELSRGAVLRLKDPLMLKIACTNYLGQKLPADQEKYTSLSLFGAMMDCISHSYAGKSQVPILECISDDLLSRYESGHAADSILLEDLRDALDDPEAPLHKAACLMFKRDGMTVAFTELLNKPERPVLRMAEKNKVQFVYERFLEFMLARSYLARHPALDAYTVCQTIRQGAVNEVFMGALRAVLIANYLETGSTAVILDLLNLYGDRFEVFSLVSGVLDVLVREIYAQEYFDIEQNLLTWKAPGADDAITEFNAVCKVIDEKKADEKTIARHRQLTERLSPMIRIHSLAGTSLIGGYMLSDAYVEGIITNDPFRLLWTLLDDPVTEVKNNACMQVYYLSGRKTTLNGNPLQENMAERIIRKMFDYLEKRSLPRLMVSGRRRARTMTLLETAGRLDVLLIFDALLSNEPGEREKVPVLLDEFRGIFRHMTANYTLLRIAMPFISLILRRQMTFQSDYVNNLKEYSAFWSGNHIARHPDGSGRWCRDDLTSVAPLVFLHSRHYGPKASRPREEAPDFQAFAPRIVAAYQTGDSLSYFILERILVIAGLSSWELVHPVLEEIDRTIPGTEWYDYSQMSFIYVLYQLGLKMDQFPAEAEQWLERNCEEWTRRRRGYFRARYSTQANPLQLYKRNVLSWYAMVWCTRHGDVADPEKKSVPLFRKLLREAIDNYDKELLVHLMNNISELITDSGHIHTALDLMLELFRSISSQEMVDRFEEGADRRYPDTGTDLVALAGNILGTAKNYFPAQVNKFLTRDIAGLRFPGIPKYKEDILNYNPGGEKLSDLLTHKFGNFIIWALIHEESVDQVVVDCLCQAAPAEDSAAWFDKSVRIVLKALLNIKL
jgi:hypothetical protein